MVGVFPKRRMLIQYGESHGNRNTAAYTITPDHIIQSTGQGMIKPSALASTSAHVLLGEHEV
ncbi:Phosphoglycerate mutase-like protein AT74 [Glycine soja]